MNLEDKVGNWIDRTRKYISRRPEDFSSYLKNGRLREYFEKIPEEQVRERERILTNCIRTSRDKYQTKLKGVRKVITKPSMAAAVVNDIYSLISKAPIANFSAVSYVLFGVKTMAELPAMLRYLRKSHDWYGAARWALMKPVNYILPIVGPMIESGSFERMVKRRVLYEAQNKFLKEIGVENEKSKTKRVLKRSIGEFIKGNPIRNPDSGLAYAN